MNTPQRKSDVYYNARSTSTPRQNTQETKAGRLERQISNNASGQTYDFITGIVKWYSPNKNFGFVIPDDRYQPMPDIFLHASCLVQVPEGGSNDEELYISVRSSNSASPETQTMPPPHPMSFPVKGESVQFKLQKAAVNIPEAVGSVQAAECTGLNGVRFSGVYNYSHPNTLLPRGLGIKPFHSSPRKKPSPKGNRSPYHQPQPLQPQPHAFSPLHIAPPLSPPLHFAPPPSPATPYVVRPMQLSSTLDIPAIIPSHGLQNTIPMSSISADFQNMQINSTSSDSLSTMRQMVTMKAVLSLNQSLQMEQRQRQQNNRYPQQRRQQTGSSPTSPPEIKKRKPQPIFASADIPAFGGTPPTPVISNVSIAAAPHAQVPLIVPATKQVSRPTPQEPQPQQYSPTSDISSSSGGSVQSQDSIPWYKYLSLQAQVHLAQRGILKQQWIQGNYPPSPNELATPKPVIDFNVQSK